MCSVGGSSREPLVTDMPDRPDSIAWIDSIGDDDAEGELRELYAAERDPASGRIDHILRVHSLHPETLRDHARLYHTIMHARSGLSHAEREMMGPSSDRMTSKQKPLPQGPGVG